MGVGSCSHAKQTAKIMIGLERIMLKERPDIVMVVGDVNSTLAGALVAGKLKIPVAHVEAGLRSFDRSMPEEINRVVTDSLSEFLFTHSKDANRNLLEEGISRERIYFVGNVMIDSLTEFKDMIFGQKRKTLDQFGLKEKEYALMTLHRPSNVDVAGHLKKILKALSEIQRKTKIIFPVHPRTEFFIKKYGLGPSLKNMHNFICTKPMGYINFLKLMNSSRFVITDSGGVQEESTVLGIPCLTVRENTERPVTVREGTNIIVGTKPSRIIEESVKIINGKCKTGRIPELWDGKASERIVNILLN